MSSPSLLDGYNGAGDASVLARYDREGSFVHVQATRATKGLLHRAGFHRVRTHNFYRVPVAADSMGRLGIAPIQS